MTGIHETILLGGFGRLLGSLTVVAPGRKWRRGDLLGLVIFGRARRVTRRGGVVTRLGYNGAVALKKDGLPVATRIFHPAYLEARVTGYARLGTLARGTL